MDFEELPENFISCKHCAGSGTCRNAENEFSCIKCSRKSRSFATKLLGKEIKGAACHVCEGHGAVEPWSFSLNNRIAPTLALAVFIGSVILILQSENSPHFEAILAFSTTLTGAVTGHYFGGRRRD
jgi:recombinational DNA repair protein RecR